jgi:hypothetical protein
VKKICLAILFIGFVSAVSAQDNHKKKTPAEDKKDAKKQKVKELIRQSEEGVLIYRKQNIFGLQGRTNGFGAFYELGRMKSNRRTNIYRIDITEIKHQKEDKQPNDGFFFGNPFIFGKINHFYQVTLGFGQQYVLGQKGNKNGVAVTAVFNGGLAIGLLRPYYVEIRDPSTGENRFIKYEGADTTLFLSNSIIGGGPFGKGFGEMKFKPGVFVKAALRFDYGRFNEAVQGIEAGVSLEMYGDKIPIMAYQKNKQLFFQGYIALIFGRRK